MAEKIIKKVRALKKGTKYRIYGKDYIELVAIAGDKRGYHIRDITIEGKEGTYQDRCDNMVEVIA